MSNQQPVIALRRHGLDDLAAVRPTLAEIYAEVYADRLSDPFFSVQGFEDRLDGQASLPGWEVVLGYAVDQPIGYAYGSRLPQRTGWWSKMLTPLPDDFTDEYGGERTLALFELMVRAPWRKTGAARRIHEELLADRPEERVTLLVEPTHPKVQTLYEEWGYENVGPQQPFPDSPIYATMVRQLR